jgi:hypothetical protein
MWIPTLTRAFLGVSILSRVALASLNVSGRFIVDASGQRVKLRCVNCELFQILPVLKCAMHDN